MIDLKTVLQEHPNCLSSKAAFRSILMDIYPNEKRMVNILTSMLECGAVQKIKSRSILNDNEFHVILGQLENEYGTAAIYASEGIKIWADAFSVSVQATSVQTTRSVIAPQPIVHAPIVETAVVEGAQSDYETIIENGCVTITKFIGFDVDKIIVPNSINGMCVKAIGKNAFAGCKGIKKIVISEGITEIRNGAFKECTSLKNVVISEGVAEIHGSAFENCASLENIILPSTLRIIGDASKLGGNVPPVLTSCTFANGKYCFSGNGTFESCRNLRKIRLPNGIQCIGPYAFANTGLTEINIPASVWEIERSAFHRCHQLSNVSLNEGLNTIGNYAFEDCDMLCSITIPKSVTTIGGDAFNRCHSDFTVFCYAGSYSLKFARNRGYQTQDAAKQ